MKASNILGHLPILGIICLYLASALVQYNRQTGPNIGQWPRIIIQNVCLVFMQEWRTFMKILVISWWRQDFYQCCHQTRSWIKRRRKWILITGNTRFAVEWNHFFKALFQAFFKLSLKLSLKLSWTQPSKCSQSLLRSKFTLNSVFYRFWSRVPKELINQLEEDSAYGHDLKMFDYSIKKYLKEIGL